MSKLDADAQRHFDYADASYMKLWMGGDVTTKDFRELCWALLNTNAAIREALDDIHNHVRQQSQAPRASAPQPAPFIIGQR